MQKFYFQAVTSDGKQISGYISAESEKEARKKLKMGGMSILTLEVREEDERKEGLQVFCFAGHNEFRKRVSGTIESADKFSAFKKLKLEYKIELDYLIPNGLDQVQKDLLKAQGIDEDLEQRLEDELKKIKKKEEKEEEVTGDDEIKSVLESRSKEISFMQEKVDSILSEIIPLLKENEDYISPAKKREIEERIDLLSRLKHSNSVDHLKRLTKNLLQQLATDELFLQDVKMSEDVQQEIERRKGEFRKLAKTFDKLITSGLADLQISVGGLDTKEIKQKVLELNLLGKALNVLYYIFVFLFSFLVVFWFWNFFRYHFDFNRAQAIFFFASPIMLYVTLFSFIVLLTFSFRFRAQNSLATKISFIGTGMVILFLMTLEFPVIFFWI